MFFFKQKTAYDVRISDWSSDVCSSDLGGLLSRSRRMARRGGGAIPCESVAGHLWLGGIESLSWWVFKGPDGPTPFASMAPPRSEERSVGEKGVNTCRYRGAPDP